jgi:hypothetical protein
MEVRTMAEQPKTIACPSCGNINPYTADKCIKCGLALGPIREALRKASAPAVEKVPTPSEPEAKKMPSAPLPPAVPSELPPLPTREAARTRTETTNDLGYLYGGRLVLIRGMADRLEQVRRLFFHQSEARGISGASYSPGQLVVENQSRYYQFAERDLGSSARATIGVRIADIGTDLYVEWRHYVLPPKEFGVGLFILVGGIVSVIACPLVGAMADDFGVGTIVALIAAAGIGALVASQSRAIELKGFQNQDSEAFQLAIRAAVDEAIDLAGISKELRMETVYESKLPKKKRLI